MKLMLILALSVALLVQGVSAFAVVIEVKVTPEFIKQNPKQFSVVSRSWADGSLRLTIVRTPERPAYLVARFQVRRQGRLVAESAHPFYALEPSETFHLTVPANAIDESVFELSERSFGETDGQKVPFPGGSDYVIRMMDFRPGATAQAEPERE